MHTEAGTVCFDFFRKVSTLLQTEKVKLDVNTVCKICWWCFISISPKQFVKQLSPVPKKEWTQGLDPALFNIISDMDNGVESTHSKKTAQNQGEWLFHQRDKDIQGDLDRLARWV